MNFFTHSHCSYSCILTVGVYFFFCAVFRVFHVTNTHSLHLHLVHFSISFFTISIVSHSISLDFFLSISLFVCIFYLSRTCSKWFFPFFSYFLTIENCAHCYQKILDYNLHSKMAEMFPRISTIFFQEFSQWIHNFHEQNQSRFSLFESTLFLMEKF